MVHFGHYIQAHQIPGWETYYIGYKQLKKRINEYAMRAAIASEDERKDILKKFSRLLDSQVEKIVLFVIERQGLLAAKLQQLRERSEDREDDEANGDRSLVINGRNKGQLMEDYRQVGNELLKLLQYVEMNIMGLRKILKKFDKRLGLRLREHYLLSRMNHPYSQVQIVLRQVGIGAIIATISQNLAELHRDTRGIAWRSTSSLSLLNIFSRMAEEEPIIKAIQSEFHRLTKEASVLSFIANSFLVQPPEEKLPEVFAEEKEYHAVSAYLNLLNTFLYMANYYIIVPSSDDYSESLNMPATLSGIVIGSMPLTATISAFVFSWWSNYCYRTPLIVSTLLLVAGNLMYALALPFNSVWLLLLGRAFEGLGCARALNRRYIVDEVPFSKVRNFSAAFVSAGALGMSLGPALASVLNYVDFEILGAPVNYYTAPGWLLALAWLVYVVFVILLFKEPKKPKKPSEEPHPKGYKAVPSVPSSYGEDIFSDSSLSHSLLVRTEDNGQQDECLVEKQVTSDDSVMTFKDVLKEMTLPVQILLFIYFMLKFAAEMLISETTLITSYYFNWSSSTVGLFLAGLGLTVLPSSAVVANYISNRYEERSILFWTIICTGVGVMGIFCYCPFIEYTEVQYILAALIIFISTNILEGVDMSLLAKVLSPRLAAGLFNGGFLSTEAGTIARAVADGLITLIGKAGVSHLLNFSMLPTLVVIAVGIVVTWFGYYSLY